MGAIASASTTLASLVANNGTFTLAYPAGTNQQSLRYAAGGMITIGDYLTLNEGANGVSFTYNPTNITVTNLSGSSWAAGSSVNVSLGRTDRNGSYNLTLGTGPDQAAPGSVAENYQELTVSGAVSDGVQSVELNNASVIIAATLTPRPGLFIVKDTSATGTAAHTLTLGGGATYNGTNTIATLNARDKALVVYFDSALRGTVIVNVGTVALS